MSSRIEVCHITTLTAWGGVERMVVDMLLHVSQERVRHSLLTTSSKPELLQAIQPAQILHYQPQGRFPRDPGKLIAMAHWLHARRIHVVHAYNAFANSWAGIATLLPGSPVLLTGEHGTVWDVRPPMAWLNRWAHHRAKLVIANSHATARLLELKYGIQGDKIRVVYNAIAQTPPADVHQVRAQLGLSDNVLIVGSVGRLNTTKDFATFIKAAALVCKTSYDVVFVLVGGGPLENELKALASDLGIKDRFIFTGSRTDARSLMESFDVFVSTSIHESFGNVLIEAGLAMLPVIAPRIDGIPEAVVHEQTGILLTPISPVRRNQSSLAAPLPDQVLVCGKLQRPRSLDPDLLANTILSMLAQPDLRLQYGQAARARALEMFSLDRYIRELEDIYLEVSNAS